MKAHVYRNIRPLLAVEHVRSTQLGRCYSESLYRVTSRRRLDRAALTALRSAGVLGYGQEFDVKSRCDGSEEPAGHDVVPCIEVDDRTGEVLNSPAINPYSGDPYPSSNDPYYVYECYSRCDSSD